jgi:hypothetical protein
MRCGRRGVFQQPVNGTSQPDENKSQVSYYDTNYGYYIGSKSSTYYSILTGGTALPDNVTTGDSGPHLSYTTYSNQNKTSIISTEKVSYRILSVSAETSIAYKARIEWKDEIFSPAGLLIGVSTRIQDLTYDTTKGAGLNNISHVVDDINGTTTSRISWVKIQ